MDLTKDDLAELNTWFDWYINANVVDTGYPLAEGELRNQAIKVHQKINRIVNYMDARVEQLKGDIEEAKIFDLPALVMKLEARLDELRRVELVENSV